MKAQLIDGRMLSEKTCKRIKARVEALKGKGVVPKLAVLLIGNNPASAAYVSNKGKKAKELGIEVVIEHREDTIPEQEIIALIESFNRDESVHGILVQLPLPKGVDTAQVLAHIDPAKDVDGLHTYNAGALASGREGFVPCTPKGVVELVKETGISIAGKEAVVVGRSNLVGKPAALLMLQHDATVTLCHSKTPELSKFTKRADILICAVGKSKLITADMVKEGAVVIDVGQIKVDGKWCGDVDFESVCEVASHITPVPGGVGPMTITMLMDNTVEAAEKRAHVR